ncbi:Uma2 family endonuclease [Prauserella sp. PE36]|uniref:Uma2 family endonuclease n=1 Tax=Prauserella sp. PE36 TaxID=1504709 RepID=UPI000D870E11|nr:Uma2 family endonuclease [Prauserella sp. PE36]PXY25013.1 hypothetical protein BAY59_23545 [Prauserella coralliicola]RBM23821.1 Uma2 family endonuclease [Prauserella sp. PE36]
MTALPEHPASRLPGVDHLLTIAEYLELGETEPGYTELIGGRLLMSPSPRPGHNIASFSLLEQLKPQLPGGRRGVQDIDVDLELTSPDQPGYSRRPGLVVADGDAVARVDREGGMLRASDLLLVVEIVSPGSKRIDTVDKRGEYADAGIPHYWIVDITEPVSLVACHLAGDFGYQDDGAVTGTFTATEPFPVRIDLAALH